MIEEITIDGGRIRSLREARGWSQRELWQKSGVDQSVISGLENDRKEDIRFSTLFALARALGVRVDELIASSGAPPLEPTDPQINVAMRLVNDMTPEERESVVAFMGYTIARRDRVAGTANKTTTPQRARVRSKRRKSA